MILLVLTALSGIGCLVALVSVVGLLIDSVRRADQGTPFLTPVLVSSRNGECVVVPFGLVQVHCLEMQSSAPQQIQDEVQEA